MQDIVVTFLASFLIWFLFLGLFVLWFIDGRIKKEQVLHAIFAVVCVWVLSAFIKEFFDVPRPFVENGVSIRTITTPRDMSFPSTHTAVAFALSTTVFIHDKKNGLMFFVGASLIALGRILANVHFPADIAFGSFLGILTALIVSKTHVFGLIPRTRH